MKISKTALISLAVGILVITAAGLGMVYSQQGQEQSRLNEELALARLRLQKYQAQQLAPEQEELENQLAKAETQLKAAKLSLYQLTESIDASNVLFELAEESIVEVTEIISSGLTTEELEGITLSVLLLTVTVEGDVLNLIDFIYKWTKEYPTGVVSSVHVNVPGVTDEEVEVGEEEAEEKKPSATISLLIYTYEDD